MPLESFFWPLLAVVVWGGTLLVVPRERFKELLSAGIVAGFLLALAIQMIGIPALKLWKFRFLELALPVLGVPLLLPFTYIAEVILFLHWLPRETATRWLYIGVFSAANTIVNVFMVRQGIKLIPHWNALATFLVAMGSHALAYYYLALFGTRLPGGGPTRL